MGRPKIENPMNRSFLTRIDEELWRALKKVPSKVKAEASRKALKKLVGMK